MKVDPVLPAEQDGKERRALSASSSKEKNYQITNNMGFLIFLSIKIYLYSAISCIFVNQNIFIFCMFKKEREKDAIWLHSVNTEPGSDALLCNRVEKDTPPPL